MITEEKLKEFDNFCNRFIKETEIRSYKEDYYFDGLGDIDFSHDVSWFDSHELRYSFELWLSQIFPGKMVTCNFNNGDLFIYQEVTRYENRRKNDPTQV